MRADRAVNLGEDMLFAVRSLCLIRIRTEDQGEEALMLIDRYGEGDDVAISLLQSYWNELLEMSKEEAVYQFRFFSKIEELTRNNRGP